ncbi:YceI family protein [Isoptericola croceus]|uniref:YceI family protein n=1 Tax=Isoptericola croceus TaxID=3031406 RepID=UPI0023F736C2|nr:YceI family protein [Isoptericola croceus]
MQKRTKIVLSVVASVVVLGVIAAFAGPVVYRDLIVGEAAAEPTVSAAPSTEATSDGGTLDDLSGTWEVADGSEAGYRVDEVLNGTDVTVTGRTDQVTGTLTVDGLTLSAAEITVDVASIATDQANRDEYFRSTAMRTDEHPTATFTLAEPVTLDGAPTPGAVTTVETTGDLTLAGVTQTVTVELQVVLDAAEGQVAGSIPVTFADYDVEAPDLGFVLVEPTGFVEFQLSLAATSP